MQQSRLLKTDFYQVAMAAAYVLLGKANNKAGFEAFVRDIKPAVANKNNYYRFSGRLEVIKFLEEIRRDIQGPQFLEDFISIIGPKLGHVLTARLRESWPKLNKEFTYSMYPEYGHVRPFVPVFQFFGPLWLGQMLETPILNIINGETGRATALPLSNRPFDLNPTDAYELYLIKRAKEYRRCTSKGLIEGGLRRSPSLESGVLASMIALDEGWDATSNTAVLDKGIDHSKVVGTMAHSFVMSYGVESEAFDMWDRIFPDSTLLIDTYDPLHAIALLTQFGIRPKYVRIDSEPLDLYCNQVRKIMDLAGWKDVGIVISGDLTPDYISYLEHNGFPFDKALVGTKYVNLYSHLNPGFVYKLVQIEDEHGIRYPEKKATNKKNYTGLKHVTVDNDRNVKVLTKSNNFGIFDIEKVGPGSEVKFEEAK